jgi:hypothetical protein
MRQNMKELLQTGRSAFDSRQAERNFFFPLHAQNSLGPTQWGNVDLTLRIKHLEREEDHSPQTNAEV